MSERTIVLTFYYIFVQTAFAQVIFKINSVKVHHIETEIFSKAPGQYFSPLNALF